MVMNWSKLDVRKSDRVLLALSQDRACEILQKKRPSNDGRFLL